jgi:hypothetical protein
MSSNTPLGDISGASLPSIFLPTSIILSHNLPLFQPIYLNVIHAHVSDLGCPPINPETSLFLTVVQIYPEDQLEPDEVIFSSLFYDQLAHLNPSSSPIETESTLAFQFLLPQPFSQQLDDKQYKQLSTYQNSLIKPSIRHPVSDSRSNISGSNAFAAIATSSSSPYIYADELTLSLASAMFQRDLKPSQQQLPPLSSSLRRQLLHYFSVLYENVPLYCSIPSTSNQSVFTFIAFVPFHSYLIPLSVDSIHITAKCLPSSTKSGPHHNSPDSIVPRQSTFYIFPRQTRLSSIILHQNRSSALQSHTKLEIRPKPLPHGILSPTLSISTHAPPSYLSTQTIVNSLVAQESDTIYQNDQYVPLKPSSIAISLIGPKLVGKSMALYHAISTFQRFSTSKATSEFIPPLYINLPIADLFHLIHPNSTRFAQPEEFVTSSTSPVQSMPIFSILSHWFRLIWLGLFAKMKTSSGHHFKVIIHFTGLDLLLRDEAHFVTSPPTDINESTEHSSSPFSPTTSTSPSLLTTLNHFIQSCSILFSLYHPVVVFESTSPSLMFNGGLSDYGSSTDRNGDNIIPTIHLNTKFSALVGSPNHHQYTVPIQFPSRSESSLILLFFHNNSLHSINSPQISLQQIYQQSQATKKTHNILIDHNLIFSSTQSAQEKLLFQLLTLQQESNLSCGRFLQLLHTHQHFLPSWFNSIIHPSNQNLPVLLDYIYWAYLNSLSHQLPNSLCTDDFPTQSTSLTQLIMSSILQMIQKNPQILSTVSKLSSQQSTGSISQLTRAVDSSLLALTLGRITPQISPSPSPPQSIKSLPASGQFIGNLALVLSLSNVIQQWQMFLNLAGNGSSTLSSSNMMDGIGGNILLYGPHGNGKSLLIQTLVIDPQSRPRSSNTASNPSIGRQIDPIKTNIIHLNPSDVYSKYLGESEKKIRHTFAIARQLAPSIVIIDNIDSIASNREDGRSDSTNTGGVDLRILSTLLNELDGLDTSSVHHAKKQVMVIATCSSLNSIDPALLRSGRFDHVLHVSTPNTHDITQLLSNELGSILSNSQIDLSLAHISLISRHMEEYNLPAGSIIQLVRQAIRHIILPR